MSWFETVRRVIEENPSNLKVYFRDDDAPWACAKLGNLMECFARANTPIDVAVIPSALDSKSSNELRAVYDEFQSTMNVHQHGFAHINHQRLGRKCEFGDERSYSEQRRDIEIGRRMLEDCLDGIDPIFTPPWNRCVQDTVSALEDLDFKVLSRISGSRSLNVDKLKEVDIDVDWNKKRKGVPLTEVEFEKYLKKRFSQVAYLGLMFHHENMSQRSFDELTTLLELFRSSEKVQCLSLMEGIELQVIYSP